MIQALSTGNVTIASLGVTYEITEKSTVFDQTTQTFVLSEKITVTNTTITGLFASTLKKGDVITGIKLSTSNEYIAVTKEHILTDFLLSCNEGDTITLLVNRNGTSLEISATLTSAHFESVK